ncbi:MAG: chromosome segregation protein SMC [Candidatus Eremiobacteraeota bacterium]|nr:chromosome segregation protein SMC [Candidatus Eremiobacteraeota bacterium]
MKLRRISAFGFKTFADPTRLEFEDGITAIVGPNGSGKSNLVDAFRWVLGETSIRSLRSNRLEDVIFSGNEQRKPLGMAEVSIIFDNGDRSLPLEYAEVELTRRAYRAGESEYFINRTAVRLRDIVDLLTGTGLGPGSYAIVSQGQIDAILTSKPTERRALFEETAGIGKFLARKAESVRRLERTEQNAIRLTDLISELQRRIPELETQVRRAKRYRRVHERVRDLEILGYLRSSASRRAESAALRARLQPTEERRDAAAARASSHAAELAAARTSLYRAELRLEELRSQAQRQRSELAAMEAQYAAVLARREALERQSTQTSADAARSEQERVSLAAAIERLEREIAPLTQQIQRARERDAAAIKRLAESRERLDAVFSELRTIEAAAGELAAQMAARLANAQNLRAEAERLEAEERVARERAEQLEILAGGAGHRHAERQRAVAALEESLLDAMGRAENAEREARAAQDDVAHALSAVHDLSGEVRAAESRLHTIEELENSLEGHVPGTRAIVDAWQRGDLGGIAGIVSNLITTSQRYARAMDVAFGVRLSNVVTETSEDAQRCVEFLNRTEAGRATFLPLDTLSGREGRRIDEQIAKMPGVIGYAHTLVRSDQRYAGIVNFLVGNVLVVERLEVGIELVRGRGVRDTIVTLDGEQITGGGAITGGRFTRERSILSRRFQAEHLREILSALRGRLEEAQGRLRSAHARAESAIAARDAQREAFGKTQSQVATARAQLHALALEAERASVDLKHARERGTELRSAAIDARRREAESEAPLPEGSEHAARRAQLENELAGVRDAIAAAEAAAAGAAAESANVRERAAALSAERDAARARLGMLDENSERADGAREEMLAEISAMMEQTRGAHARIEGLRRGISATDAELDVVRQEREALLARQTQLESDQRSAEHDEREIAADAVRQRTRLAEVEAELGMLVSQFAQNPATEEECAEVAARYADAADPDPAELPRLRDELARLQANVNLNAEAERDEVAERERFLQAQFDDLTAARQTLLQSISEIELQTQAQFNETFEQVAGAFAATYERLFPGGRARMWQTDPQNLSESGIEIAVQPPGKKDVALPALSGGERAMTAAALIFALIATRPAPLYLLDEVDAALDDANIDRFCTMVRDFAARSQMLIVTHNKRTMEMADRIYGVTSGESGASAIVSVELAPQAEALLA